MEIQTHASLGKLMLGDFLTKMYAMEVHSQLTTPIMWRHQSKFYLDKPKLYQSQQYEKKKHTKKKKKKHSKLACQSLSPKNYQKLSFKGLFF